MKTLYSTAMRVALSLFPLAKGWKGKAGLLVNAQLNFEETLSKLSAWRDSCEHVIWFHCASLGEFEQGRPVLEEYKKLHSDYKVLLTFFSPSGYEVRKNYAGADFICYVPWDVPGRARAFVKAARAEKVVIVKYEFWPNLIHEIKASGAELIGISVILRENQAFFKSWGEYLRDVLFAFDHLFVQNQKTVDLLEKIGYRDYTLAGDTRFDRVIATAKVGEEIQGLSTFLENKKVLVAGSVWPEDMDVLIPFMRNHPEMKFIVAPHDIKSDQIQKWRSMTGGILYSQFDPQSKEQILYIDNVGMLSKLYKYGHYAWVGGAYRTGLHNILEPVVFGVPVFFGNKKYKKFQEALDLLELGVAHAISENLEEVFQQIDPLVIKTKAQTYVQANAGATEKILKFLEPLR